MVVIGGSTALYAVLGHPALDQALLAVSSQPTVHARSGAELQELAERLAARLAQSPHDICTVGHVDDVAPGARDLHLLIDAMTP